MFSCGSSNPPKAVLRGKQPTAENFVLYPPRLFIHLISIGLTRTSVIQAMEQALQIISLSITIEYIFLTHICFGECN